MKAERGTIQIFIAGSLWGSIGLFIRLMSDAGAPAEEISFLRMVFAFGILLVVTVIRSGVAAFCVGWNHCCAGVHRADAV